MWNYEKRLQYPVKITQTNPKIAQIIITQFGGPDGELGASMRYLAQRYTMPYKEVTGILTDIGTEELAHLEMICAIVYQLTKNLSPEEIERSGFAPYYVDHTLALWPQAASGTPWSATTFQSKGDPITDLSEDLAVLYDCFLVEELLTIDFAEALAEEFTSMDVLFYHAKRAAIDSGLVKKGDRIVITGGNPNGKSGNSNVINIEQI